MIETTYEIEKVPIVEKYNVAFRNKINLCHRLKDKDGKSLGNSREKSPMKK